MRDYSHFCQLIKNVTLLHYFQRPYTKTDGKKFLIASLQDIQKSLALYREVFETTRTGTEQRVLDFYHNILCGKDKDGHVQHEWYLREATRAYNEKAPKKLSEESIRQMMDRLDQIGYVNTEKAKDRRRNLYVLLEIIGLELIGC